MMSNPLPPENHSKPTSPENPTILEVLKQAAPETVEKFSPKEKDRIARIETQFHLRSGPLPDPALLAAYNALIPDGANRIMRMAENQSGHRIDIERIAVTSQQEQSSRGQRYALIIGLACIGGAVYAAINGHDTFASILAGTTLISLVGAFLTGKILQAKDLADKRPKPPAARPSKKQR